MRVVPVEVCMRRPEKHGPMKEGGGLHPYGFHTCMFTFGQSGDLWHSGTEHHTAAWQLFLRPGVRRWPSVTFRYYGALGGLAPDEGFSAPSYILAIPLLFTLQPRRRRRTSSSWQRARGLGTGPAGNSIQSIIHERLRLGGPLASTTRRWQFGMLFWAHWQY